MGAEVYGEAEVGSQKTVPPNSGTGSSNPSPSSRESHANLSFRAVLAVDGDRKVRVVIGAAAAGISSEAAEAQRSRLLPKIEATDDEARLQLPPQRAVAILTSSLGRYIPGTSAAFISGLEQGRRNPTIVSIYELANALGVSHIELARPIEGQ